MLPIYLYIYVSIYVVWYWQRLWAFHVWIYFWSFRIWFILVGDEATNSHAWLHASWAAQLWRNCKIIVTYLGKCAMIGVPPRLCCPAVAWSCMPTHPIVLLSLLCLGVFWVSLRLLDLLQCWFCWARPVALLTGLLLISGLRLLWSTSLICVGLTFLFEFVWLFYCKYPCTHQLLIPNLWRNLSSRYWQRLVMHDHATAGQHSLGGTPIIAHLPR